MPIRHKTINIVKNTLKNYNAIKSALGNLHSVRKGLAELCLSGSISEKEFYKVCSLLSPHSRSTQNKKFFLKKNRGTHVKANEEKGNLKIDGKHYIYKSSCNDDGKVHIVQTRSWQNCDYIIQHIEIDKCVTTFVLTHAEMESESTLLGGSAHGSKKANKKNKNVEKRMTFTMNDPTWKRWIRNYTKKRFPVIDLT